MIILSKSNSSYFFREIIFSEFFISKRVIYALNRIIWEASEKISKNNSGSKVTKLKSDFKNKYSRSSLLYISNFTLKGAKSL